MSSHHACVRCGGRFTSERPLMDPCFCPACLDDVWQRGVERGRRLAWFDGPGVAADVAPDAHLRAVGAPRLFEVDS
jgi:hypothetical protein